MIEDFERMDVINVKACRNFFDVGVSDKYKLFTFSFINVKVTDEANAFSKNVIDNTFVKNLVINGNKIK